MVQKPPADRAAGRGDPLLLCRRKPPSLPSTTAAQRAMDRFVRIGDAYGGWLLVAVVVVLFVLGGFLPIRGELAADVAASAIGGAYCLANFWRCREPHCVVTGIGWAGLTVFAVVELFLGRSLIGGFEQMVFLGILVIAIVFEAVWRATTGSNALRSRAAQAADDARRERTCSGAG